MVLRVLFFLFHRRAFICLAVELLLFLANYSIIAVASKRETIISVPYNEQDFFVYYTYIYISRNYISI